MIQFVPAQKSDIPNIQNLAKTIWHQNFAEMISLEQITYMLKLMYNSRQIEEEMEDGVLYDKICLDQEAIGYLSYALETVQRSVKLSKLYLLKEYHSQGIGRAALTHVIDYAVKNKTEKVYLYVNKKNHKAIHAYKGAGFEIAESVIKDIGAGFVMDDYKMVRLINLAPQLDSGSFIKTLP